MARNRIIDWLLVTAFAAVLLAPAISQVAGWDLESAPSEEKRMPVPLPRLPRSVRGVREFPRQFDAWFKDHFGLRRLLIAAHAHLLHDVLHTSPNPTILLGRDGWLFYDSVRAADGDTIADARGTKPLSPYALEYWRWMLEDLHAYYAAHQIPFYAVFVPTKELVYPEYLPAWVTRLSSATAIDELCDYMHLKNRVPVLNLNAALQAAKSTRPLYHRPDSHWNAVGAYHAYRAIMELIRDVPRLTPPMKLNDFTQRERLFYGGDLANMAGISRWTSEPVVEMETARPSSARDWRTADYEAADAISTNANTALPRAMFIRDSFAASLIPFLKEHFAYAYYRWCNTSIDPKALSITNIDLAVLIFSDRHMRLPMDYPARIQESFSSQRFAKGEPLARFTPAMLAGQPHSPDLLMASVTNGVQLRMLREGDGDLILPAFPVERGKLPIVQVELTSKRGGDLAIAWESDRTDNGDQALENRVASPAPAGHAFVHLPLLDPEMKGKVRLRLAAKTSVVEIHGIEIRTIPR